MSYNTNDILICHFIITFLFVALIFFSAHMMGKDREVNNTIKRVLYSLTNGRCWERVEGCDRNIAINRSNVKYMSETCLSPIPKPQVYEASSHLSIYPFKLMDRRCFESGNRSTFDDLSNFLLILISKRCEELNICVCIFLLSPDTTSLLR